MEVGEGAGNGLVRLPLELSCAYFDHLERLESKGTFQYNPRLDITLQNLLPDQRVKLSYNLDIKEQVANRLSRFTNTSIRTMLEGGMVGSWDEGITAPGEDTEGAIVFERYVNACEPYDCTYYEEPQQDLKIQVAFVLAYIGMLFPLCMIFCQAVVYSITSLMKVVKEDSYEISKRFEAMSKQHDVIEAIKNNGTRVVPFSVEVPPMVGPDRVSSTNPYLAPSFPPTDPRGLPAVSTSGSNVNCVLPPAIFTPVIPLTGPPTTVDSIDMTLDNPLAPNLITSVGPDMMLEDYRQSIVGPDMALQQQSILGPDGEEFE
jgi:hypothetical protein